MRRCLAAAAAPGEAPLELFSGLSSALPERANGDASPVSTDPLPQSLAPRTPGSPWHCRSGFLLLAGTALLRSSGLSLGPCLFLPSRTTAFCFSVSHTLTPCSLALKSRQACVTSVGVQIRNILVLPCRVWGWRLLPRPVFAELWVFQVCPSLQPG